MNNDKRRHPRKHFNSSGNENDFSFFLEEKGRLYEIKNVQDVSISGIGVGMSKEFKIDQKVALKYKSADYHLSINGTIAWCNSTSHIGSCRLGVKFDSGNQENNTLFFLAVRKYLDPFDSIPYKS